MFLLRKNVHVFNSYKKGLFFILINPYFIFMDKINNDSLNIDGIFKNFYLVPDYQREYVWQNKNAEQLLQDVLDEYNGNKESEYFIGSIVVCKTKDNKFELIDGQQRLTTTFIILNAFKARLNFYGQDTSAINSYLFASKINYDGKQEFLYRLNLQYENMSGVIENIVNGTENEIDTDNISSSGKNILNVYECVKVFLENNFKNVDELRGFFGYFINKIVLIQIETPNISDALKIFETINERGIGLDPMDLLKNLIFRQVNKENFGLLSTEWKKITKSLDKENEKPLRFLRYFIMSNYTVKNSRGEEIIREDEIYEWINKKENIEQCNYIEKPLEFVNFMNKNVEAYINFINGKDAYGEDNEALNNINNLGGSGFRQHLILLLSARNLDKELFSALVKQIENLLFYYTITKEPTKILERTFSKWTKIIRNIKTKEDLNNFIETEIKKEIDDKQSDFENAFRYLNLKSLQGYRIKYILSKITQFVDREFFGSQEYNKKLDSYINKGVEVEHILPNTAKQEIVDLYNGEYENYKIKLGNLTLLEKPINIVASNGYFDTKKKEYAKSSFYLTSSMVELKEVGKNTSINRVNKYLKSFDNWDKNSIDERQEILLNLSKEIWKVETLC